MGGRGDTSRDCEMADYEKEQEPFENGLSHSINNDEDSPELNEQKEEERTLTDHLNKKLLESFLNRLEEGSMSFPDTNQENSEEDNDFEDWRTRGLEQFVLALYISGILTVCLRSCAI